MKDTDNIKYKETSNYSSCEENTIRDLISSDYWKYVYTATHFTKKFPDIISRNRQSIAVLSDHIGRDGYDIICMINAVILKLSGQKYTYDLESLSKDEVFAISDLAFSSCHMGYYPWDIDRLCQPEEILDFFIQHGSMPCPPIPFASNREQQARLYTYNAVHGRIFEWSGTFKKELLDTKYICNFSYTLDDDKIFEENYKQIKFIRQMTIDTANETFNDTPLSENHIADIIKKRKYIIKDSYHKNSNIARCIGLIMYQYMDTEGDINKFYKNFILTDTYKKLCDKVVFENKDEPHLSDKDPTIVKSWLKITINCIEEKAVKSFKR